MVLLSLLVGCGGAKQLSGEQLSTDLIDALHQNQFYKSAEHATCEPVAIKAGAVSDCTVTFRKGLFIGDSAREHSVRVTMDDSEGHFSYWVGG